MTSLAHFVNAARWLAPHRSEHQNTVLRAFTGAGLLTGESMKAGTIAEAAASVAVCSAYVAAAKIILEADDKDLLRAVLHGWQPLIPTANQVRPRVRLVRDFKSVTTGDLKVVATAVGVDRVWDHMIAPNVV